MATTYWTGGASDGVFSNASNWSGSAPGSGDIAVVNATSQAIKAIDYSSTAFSELRIGPSFTGSFGTVAASGGSPSSYVKISVANVDINTESQVYLQGAITGTCIVSDTARGSNAVKLDTTTGTLRVIGGKGEVLCTGSLATATNVELIDAPSASIRLSDGSFGTNIVVNSGILTLQTDAVANTKVVVSGGQLNLEDGSIATLELWADARVTDTRSDDATITTLTAYDGFYDGRNSTAGVLTFTNCTLYDGATLDERSGLLNYVYTNGIVFAGQGVFKPDTGRSVTQS